ncbi:hypothetical protein STXM2123_1573 [Streptomyces sp. F-3]|nr:hypothetical protein STXM2123_1573 [Streptomyces sp. F-3]
MHSWRPHATPLPASGGCAVRADARTALERHSLAARTHGQGRRLGRPRSVCDTDDPQRHRHAGSRHGSNEVVREGGRGVRVGGGTLCLGAHGQ